MIGKQLERGEGFRIQSWSGRSDLGIGDLPVAIWFLQQSPTCGLHFDNQLPRIMTRSLLKIVLLSAVGAAALFLSSCNTISGFGRDLQDASSAVQNR